MITLPTALGLLHALVFDARVDLLVLSENGFEGHLELTDLVGARRGLARRLRRHHGRLGVELQIPVPRVTAVCRTDDFL